jgi:hypothetical protein
MGDVARMTPASRWSANLAVAYWKKDVSTGRSSLTRAEQLGLPINPSFKSDLEKAPRSRPTRPREGRDARIGTR